MKTHQNKAFWIQQKPPEYHLQFLHISVPGVLRKLAAGGCEATESVSESQVKDQFLLFHLPDGHFSVKFPCSAQDVAILGRAQSHHLVAVAVQLLQDLVALCVQDVNLPFG